MKWSSEHDAELEVIKKNAADEKPEAMLWLARYYNITGINYKRSFDLATKLAEKGDKAAHVLLSELYENGRWVDKNESIAFEHARRGFDLNNPTSIRQIGNLYSNGDGEENSERAFEMFQKGALHGDVYCMLRTSACYAQGNGVIKNPEEALMWLYIWSAKNPSPGGTDSGYGILQLERNVGAEKSQKAQSKARFLIKKIDEKTPLNQEHSAYANSDTERTVSTGSGVFVSSTGLVVTAAHVVSGCHKIQVVTETANVKAQVLSFDKKNDIALLQAEGGPFEASPIDLTGDAKLGAHVFTIGFPHIDIQGKSPKVTYGEISSNQGIMDDPTCWQISVPVQMGNSGGGLFDESGNVIGIVVSKIDAVESSRIAGDSFQNVNYAVKGEYLAPLIRRYFNQVPQINKRVKESQEDVIARAVKSAVLIRAE